MGHRTTTKTALIRIASRGNHTEFPWGWKNDVGFSRKRRRTSSCMQRQRIRRQLLPNQITRKSRTPSSTFGNYTSSRLSMDWHLYRLDGMVMGRIFLQERVGLGYETLRIRVRRVQFESPRLQLNTTACKHFILRLYSPTVRAAIYRVKISIKLEHLQYKLHVPLALS